MALLFYDRNAGQGEFYDTDGQGNIALLKSYSGWRTSWTHIVPGYFAAGNRNTALLFYNSSSGLAQFYIPDGHGGINLLSSHTSWRKSWAEIVSIDLPHS